LNDKYSFVDSYYSHGYLIPFLSAYLIYQLRGELQKIPPSADRLGLIVIVAALGIHILAMMSDINFISGFSILFYIIGCSLYLYGRGVTRKIAFPLFFLIFMFPIPDYFINMIGLPSKSIATDIGMIFINWLDIPFYREGFRITLAEASMLVGTPCNGMKSLIAFSALGVLAIYLTRLEFKKGLMLLILIYPLSVFLNGLRIAILVYIADRYGVEKASPESFVHDLSGLVVFLVGLVIIFIVFHLLQGKTPGNRNKRI
jgi:exosortase